MLDVRALIEKELMNLRTMSHGSIQLSMVNYIKDILEKLPDQNLYPNANPAEATLYDYDEHSIKLNKQSKKELHKVVAQLLYLRKRTRPGIMLPVHYLCTRVRGSTVEDKKKLERVPSYLKGTLYKKRTIVKDNVDVNNGQVRAYIDASFSAHNDGMGQSGGVIMFGNAVFEPIITKTEMCIT